MIKNSVFLYLFMFAGFCQAALTPNLMGEQVGTLPKGRFMVSSGVFLSSMNQRFNSNGKRELISNNFNQKLSWNEIGSADPRRSEQFKGLLDSQSISSDSTAGAFVGDFNGEIQGNVPVIGHGLTDEIGLYVALPILRFRAQSNVAYQKSDNAQGFINKLVSIDQKAAANELAAGLNDGFNDELERAGYKYEKTVDRTLLGDLRIDLMHVKKNQNPLLRFATVTTLLTPTGKTADPTDLYGFSSGEGRVGVGLREVAELNVLPQLALLGSAGMTYKFVSSRKMRVPRFEGDKLSSDIDSSVSVRQGHEWTSMLVTRYLISRSFIARVGLQHQGRLKDNYSGNKFNNSRYSALSQGTNEHLENTFVSLEMNTIKAFLDRDWFIPGSVLAAYSIPLAGKNSLSEKMGLVQASVFF